MLILRVVTGRHLANLKNARCYYQTRHLATQTQTKSDLTVDFKQGLPAPRPKKPKREPFAKNLFIGKFDHEFLTYPEPQHVDRYNEFQLWLEPLKDYMKSVNPKEFETSGKIPSHVIQNFREIGLFGARISEDYKGMNLLHSEFMQILETVGTVPALGLFLLKQAVPAIDVFNKYGTVEQKFKYLPKIATGQSLATIALTEPNTGPMASNLETVAVLSEDEKYWTINGEKTFVANGDMADVFIVFGHGMQSNLVEKRPEIVSSFIVDKDTEGLTVVSNPIETVGLKGFHSNKIILKDVKVPHSNIIGEVGSGAKQIVDLFSHGRHFIAALTIPLLRNFSELLIKNCLNKKYFQKPLHETMFAQSVINNLNLSIYAIESVLYLTTGTMDIYDDQDVQMETALVEHFCVQECLRILQESTWLIGPQACTTVLPFEQIMRDAFTITNYETLLHDSKIYSALLGIQHTGQTTVDEIKKLRNPLMFPAFIYKQFFKSDYLNLGLEEYLHQSLKECAQLCDNSVYQLKARTEELLIRYGFETTDQQMDLMRLSEIVSLIYAKVAVLGRSSRSYCIGNRDSELEITMALVLCARYNKKVKEIADDLHHGRYVNGDYLSNSVSQRNFATKSYFAAHPLQRNY